MNRLQRSIRSLNWLNAALGLREAEYLEAKSPEHSYVRRLEARFALEARRHAKSVGVGGAIPPHEIKRAG